MGQPRVTERIVKLAASGGADTARCWDASEGEAFENMSITVSSRGTVYAAGNLDWEVFYGGTWSGGEPFVEGTTHTGGVSKGSASIAGGTTVLSEIYTDAGPFPSNRIIPHPSGDHERDKGRNGLPIVLELTNNKAVPITVYVVFQSETVTDWR